MTASPQAEQFKRFFLTVALLAAAVSLAQNKVSAIDYPPHNFSKGHFTIYYDKDLKFANKVCWKAEFYYKQLLRQMGIADFRPWESGAKCSIVIFRAMDKFEDEMKVPGWYGAKAQKERLILATFEDSPHLLGRGLPRELTRLILWEYFEGQDAPLWLICGIARYEEEKAFDYDYEKYTLYNVLRDSHFTMFDLLYKEELPEKTEDFELFYAQSASVVAYLRSIAPPPRFTAFLAGIKNGLSVNDALKSAYSGKFPRGYEDLARFWLESVKTSH